MTGIVGLLLAAGRSERFGSAKLHALLVDGPDAGVSIGVAACRRLLAAVPATIAVVRPGDGALAQALAGEGARVITASNADDGIAATLAAGVGAAPDAGAYVVALADMPWIEPSTIARVAQAMSGGASIAAPVYRGQRGHPVGFASVHRAALLALRGDEGARPLIHAHRADVVLIDVDDPGVLRDVDTPKDLAPR